jgi:hypothetical protein
MSTSTLASLPIVDIRNKTKTAGYVPSSAATRSASGTVGSLHGRVFCRSQSGTAAKACTMRRDPVRQKLAVQFGCRLNVFAFTVTQNSWQQRTQLAGSIASSRVKRSSR